MFIMFVFFNTGIILKKDLFQSKYELRFKEKRDTSTIIKYPIVYAFQLP